MRACASLRRCSSGGATSLMPRTAQVLCTSSAPKTDQVGEGAYVAITPETLEALKQLRQDSGVMTERRCAGVRAGDVADKPPC